MTPATSLRSACCALALAASASMAAHAQTTATPTAAASAAATAPLPRWQREAIPYYTTVDMLQGLYRHGLPVQAQDFERTAQAMTSALAALCRPAAGSTPAADLAGARTAWRSAMLAWQRLTAVAVGPVIERRSQRAMDFTPTRSRLIERAIQTQPQGSQAMERVGTPAKGLPALEWLLYTQPVAPATPACAYAQEVALDIAREATALQTAHAAAAQFDWAADDAQEQATQAMTEWINQWVGGLERLRWAHMEKPLRAAQDHGAPDYPRKASQQTTAAWTAAWAAVQQQTVLPDNRPVPAPGQGLVPLEMLLRGMGLNPLADQLVAATAQVTTAFAELAAQGTPQPQAVLKTTKALAALKYLAEADIAPALQISIGFSDADGD